MISIGRYAFSGCRSLTKITLPNSVTCIGAYAFSNCDSLQFNEYGNARYLGSENNPYFALVKAVDNNVTNVDINEATEIICGDAFGYCEKLTNVTIPYGVTSIGERAFEGCSSLTSITIPDRVESN